MIVTEYTFPPVPSRGNDWQAHDTDDEGQGLIGRGATEVAALRDLAEQQASALADLHLILKAQEKGIELVQRASAAISRESRGAE